MKKLALFLLTAAMVFFPSCKSGGFALPDNEAAQAFAAFFAKRWPTAEGAADQMALPEGTVFCADLTGDGAPELLLTYSGWNTTGILAYDIGGAEPVELGSDCLGVVPPPGESLPFSLWGGGGSRVLYTAGQAPAGAAVTTTYRIENFLALADGKLACYKLQTTLPEDGEPSYYDTPPGNEPLASGAYEKARKNALRSPEPLETVETGAPFDFFAEPGALEEAVRERLSRWRETH